MWGKGILKRSNLLLVLVVWLVLGTSCGTADSKHLDVAFKYPFDWWNIYDLSDSLLQDQESFESLVVTYLQDAEECLKYDDWWKRINPEAKEIILNVKFTDNKGTVSRADYGKIALEDEIEAGVTLSGMYLTKYKSDGFLAHELTHIMIGPTFSISLEDGLCQYVQRTVGQWSHIPEVTEGKISYEDYFKTFHEHYKKSVIKMHGAENMEASSEAMQEDVMMYIGKEGRQYPEINRMVWNTYSEAFCQYLIDEYGIEKVMDLVKNGKSEDSYKTILGKELEDLKADWLQAIDHMEQKYTWEELIEMEKTLP